MASGAVAGTIRRVTETPGERTPPRRRRAEVLEAAGELFLDKGFEATSTADIADVKVVPGPVQKALKAKLKEG